MSDLITILQERSASRHKELDTKLYSLALMIISKTEEHQKRVIKVMPEVSVSAILYCDVWLLLVPLLCIIKK